MSDHVNVGFTDGKKYIIDIGSDFECLKNHVDTGRRYFIITDDNVSDLYCKEFNSLVFNGRADVFSFKSGENSKNYTTVQNCYNALLSKGHDRSSVIMALGGGVVGDISGFVASTFMRGIEYIQIPTTLLAMVDSSSGGKTGYNLEGTKNIIGTFYQPKLVYINLSCIKTLSRKEFSVGMAECIKHGLIMDEDYFHFIENSKDRLMSLDEKVLLHLVKRSCEIKACIVGKDEKETGTRELLNFGHTIGHAVEAASGYILSHGEAVSIGINAALSVSDMQEEDIGRIRTLLRYFYLPLKYKGSREEIMKHLACDKKFKNGVFSFIILKKIGEAYICKIKGINELIDILETILEN